MSIHVIPKHPVPGDAATPSLHVATFTPGIMHVITSEHHHLVSASVSFTGSTMAVTSYANNICDTELDCVVGTCMSVTSSGKCVLTNSHAPEAHPFPASATVITRRGRSLRHLSTASSVPFKVCVNVCMACNVCK